MISVLESLFEKFNIKGLNEEEKKTSSDIFFNNKEPELLENVKYIYSDLFYYEYTFNDFNNYPFLSHKNINKKINCVDLDFLVFLDNIYAEELENLFKEVRNGYLNKFGCKKIATILNKILIKRIISKYSENGAISDFDKKIIFLYQLELPPNERMYKFDLLNKHHFLDP